MYYCGGISDRLGPSDVNKLKQLNRIKVVNSMCQLLTCDDQAIVGCEVCQC